MLAPDYCAQDDCGEYELPVQLVVVGEDAHPQEEEDDAVAEKTKDKMTLPGILLWCILPGLGDGLGGVVDGDIAIGADVGHAVPGR